MGERNDPPHNAFSSIETAVGGELPWHLKRKGRMGRERQRDFFECNHFFLHKLVIIELLFIIRWKEAVITYSKGSSPKHTY